MTDIVRLKSNKDIRATVSVPARSSRTFSEFAFIFVKFSLLIFDCWFMTAKIKWFGADSAVTGAKLRVIED